MTTTFTTQYREQKQGYSAVNPDRIELTSPGVIVIDGVQYDYAAAEDANLNSFLPSAYLSVLRKNDDWDILYLPEGSPSTAVTEVTYEDDELPAYPVWPEGETQAAQTVTSTDTTSVPAQTQAQTAASMKKRLTLQALAYETQFALSTSWPNADRVTTTQSWGQRWIGCAWRSVEDYEKEATDVETAKATADDRVKQCEAEIGIGVRTWYAVHVLSEWQSADTNMILYSTDTDGGTGSVAIPAGDKATWDDWYSDAYGAALTA